MARVSDIYGRRPTLYAALGLFLLGSLIAALSPNIFVLIGGRAVQGLGGGGLFALSQILIGDLLPPRERGRYAAWISGMWAVAGIAGPLLGGTLAECLLAADLLAQPAARPDRHLRRQQAAAKAHRRHAPHRLDVLGALLLVVATSSLLLMLNWGGSAYAVVLAADHRTRRRSRCCSGSASGSG